MKNRTDLWTASRVDATLILLPLIGVIEAERMLFAAGIRTSVIERVIHQPAARRAVSEEVAAPGPVLESSEATGDHPCQIALQTESRKPSSI